MIHPKLRAIKEAKVEQFQKVIDTANAVLSEQNKDDAFNIIRDEFSKYEALADKEERFLFRHKQMSILQCLLTYRTIADVWWKLPIPVRDLWDANPDLLAWRTQFR